MGEVMDESGGGGAPLGPSDEWSVDKGRDGACSLLGDCTRGVDRAEVDVELHERFLRRR